MDPTQRLAIIYAIFHGFGWPFYLGYLIRHRAEGNNWRFGIPLALMFVIFLAHTGSMLAIVGRVLWGW